MSTKRCMNAGCMVASAAAGVVWRKGWLLRSGGFATLCDKCGLAYEQLVFCDKFHPKESGWRECAFCGKRLHCGCIASKSMLDLLDGGGVQCLGCLKNFENSTVLGESFQDLLPQSSQLVFALPDKYLIEEKMNEIGTSLADRSSELHPTSSGRILIDGTAAKCNVMKFRRNIEVNGSSTMLLAQRGNMNGSFEHVKQERVALHLGELGRPGCSVQDQGPLGLSQISHQNDNKDASKENYPMAEACHIMSFGNPIMSNILEACPKTGAWQVAPSHLGAVNDGRDQKKAFSTFHHVERAHYGLPKLPKTIRGTSSDVAKELVPQMHVARPPAEGKGRNQLLPRYWPRITEQELQQISGDSNSTIVPLFEKVLSASDAGRVGRLVLPKACAEAYFPPISQPEGLALKIQDSKGKEWHFQFRFWPNNNSRMYVLEGVTPCIQSLQLQAGDTVTFSRIDPEGKLLMGFRKATNTVSLQDSQISAMANEVLGSETFSSEVNVGLSVVSGYSGFLQSFKGTGDPQFSHFSKNSNYAGGNFSCTMTHKLKSWEYEGLLHPLLVPEKRRSRNIGFKGKRLLMDSEDAMELKLTWEEAQDLLRPPPSVKPSIVIIEDQEFEEYEEPPVLGKRTFFTARASGGQDQWIQCDDCFKWRRIPVEVMPPLKWACAENTWDSKRSSCAEPDELTSMELQALLRQHSEIKRRRITSPKESAPVVDSTGLEEVSDQATPSVAATTRHPRHRPGCTCIVCIQPPSGKGPKHSSTCTCNVCTTVKRRFNTIMLRKKKRQSDREEAELSKMLLLGSKEEVEGLSSSFNLNCQPQLDGEQQASSPQVSMMNLLQVSSFPDENYLKQNRLISLATSDQKVSPIVCESAGDDENCGSDKVISDAAAT